MKKRFWPFLTAAFVAAAAVAVLFGQGTSVFDAAAGLKELTAEVRQLRLAVEASTRTQAQTQALGMYLTAEQSRIAQAAARLDAARKDLDAADALSRRLTADAASLEAALSGESEPARRRDIEMQQRATKQELDGAEVQLQQARTREAEVSQALQAEEARWNDLVSALERIVKQ
jgi:chromosome segregation ATPase